MLLCVYKPVEWNQSEHDAELKVWEQRRGKRHCQLWQTTWLVTICKSWACNPKMLPTCTRTCNKQKAKRLISKMPAAPYNKLNTMKSVESWSRNRLLVVLLHFFYFKFKLCKFLLLSVTKPTWLHFVYQSLHEILKSSWCKTAPSANTLRQWNAVCQQTNLLLYACFHISILTSSFSCEECGTPP